MRRIFRAAAALALLLLCVAPSHGATLDELSRGVGGGAAGGASIGFGSDRGLGATGGPSLRGAGGGETGDFQGLKRSLSGMEPETESEEELRRKAPKLILKAEPGDGLVTVSWTVSGVKQEDLPLRFAVKYGSEPGQYTKTVSVGSVATYRLRELKNNQVYYVRVEGVGKDLKPVASSAEVRVIPIPAEEQASLLEKSFAHKSPTLQERVEAEAPGRELRQFGYDFFRNSLTAATAMESLPVGNDYVIGPGDSLRIDIWGGFQARHELTVDRNGEITIPRVGSVKVWGLSYAQAKEAINKAVSRLYRGYELNVTLGRLRTIQVYVVGEVEAPGTYTVSSLATVVNALAAAGGPSRNGSLRSVKLTRNGKVVQEIDLYDIFLSGDRSRDVRIENGDTLFVPVIGPVAAVAGEVKRPAIYELKGKTTLPALLAMAGGITAAGDTGRVQLERIEGNSARVVVDYEPKGESLEKELGNVEVKDRDMVKVFPVQQAVREVVTLSGNVSRPGSYQFRKGMRVRDLIPSFAALLPDSYLETAEVTRLAPPDLHREVVSFNLRKALEGDEKENLPLLEQDAVRIFSRAEMTEKPTVSINGFVVNSGAYDYYPRMTVRELVMAAGSVKRNAFLESAELTRIEVKDGIARATRIEISLDRALKGEPEHNLFLQPDDVVIVRGIENWLEAADRFVTLKGEVKFPGVYSIAKGERISSVIARAGGFTDKAYLRGAKFTRKSVQEEQQKRMDEVLARTEQDILRKQVELTSLASSREELEATRAALEALTKSLEKLKALKAQGRVVMRLAELDRFKGGPYDLELVGGDALEIPQTPGTVNVMGVVYNPSSFVHMPSQDVSFYLKKAGGPMRDAEEDEMFIIKADGSVTSRQQSTPGIRWDEDGRRWTFGSFLSTRLEPGDTLVVPQRLERIAWMRNIKDITTILSQVAVTAGIIIAAGL